MNKTTLLFAAFILLGAMSANAKTYTLSSGKWTDPKTWNDDYPGTTVKAEDVVVIKGNVIMTSSIVVEGILWVEKGASVVGYKELVISHGGKLINNGNTVMEKIINNGYVMNNQSLDAIMDIDNKGTIENKSNLVAGNNFDNTTGAVTGSKSTFFAQNSIITSQDSKFGPGVRFFYGNTIERWRDSVSTSQDVSGKQPDPVTEPKTTGPVTK